LAATTLFELLFYFIAVPSDLSMRLIWTISLLPSSSVSFDEPILTLVWSGDYRSGESSVTSPLAPPPCSNFLHFSILLLASYFIERPLFRGLRPSFILILIGESGNPSCPSWYKRGFVTDTYFECSCFTESNFVGISSNF